MIGFDLLRPGLLWLVPLALVLGVVGTLAVVRRHQVLELVVHRRQLRRFAPGLSRTRALLRVGLASGGFLLAAFSAVGPVRGYTETPVVRRGLDIVCCIDTSRSMLARDLRPTRLDRALREVKGLLDHLRGDRCALIAFSGDAREVAPLTHDRRTLRTLLDYVGPDDNRRGGTDLAAALERALSMFDGRTGAHEAIVLLTDGEDLEGRAREVAEEAADRGIRVYVVGVGTAAGGKIPITGADGSESFLKGPDGQEVVTHLDDTTLREIARLTGGEYLSPEASPTPLEELYEKRIRWLEGRDLKGGVRRVPHDRYQWACLLGLLCMLAEVGLRERRPQGRTGA